MKYMAVEYELPIAAPNRMKSLSTAMAMAGSLNASVARLAASTAALTYSEFVPPPASTQ
jgi:hypothetical protein